MTEIRWHAINWAQVVWVAAMSLAAGFFTLGIAAYLTRDSDRDKE